MSLETSSHHSHEEGHDSHHDTYYPGLEPGVKAIRQKTKKHKDGTYTSEFIATHRYPNGEYYYTRHKNIGEASLAISENKERKSALGEGLYRLKEGQFRHPKTVPSDHDQLNNVIPITRHKVVPVRPEASSTEFLESAGLVPDAIEIIQNSENSGSEKFISANEREQIEARSEAIIRSAEARDKALAEGKSIEEAQSIGEKMWRVYHQMGDAPVAPLAESPSSETKSEIEPNQQKEKRSIGRRALVMVGLIFTNLPTMQHYALHKFEDKFKLQEKFNSKKEKLLDTFERLVSKLEKDELHKLIDKIEKATIQKMKEKRAKNSEYFDARLSAIEDYLREKHIEAEPEEDLEATDSETAS